MLMSDKQAFRRLSGARVWGVCYLNSARLKINQMLRGTFSNCLRYGHRVLINGMGFPEFFIYFCAMSAFRGQMAYSLAAGNKRHVFESGANEIFSG
jgi:hypothetical protein